MKLKKITVGFLSIFLVIGSVFPTLHSVFATTEQNGWFLDFSSGAQVIENNVYIDNSVKTLGEYSETNKVAVFTSTENNLTSATRTPGIILGGTVTSKSDKELSVKDNSVTDYPIVAIKLKLSNPEIKVDRFDWTTDDLETKGIEQWRSMTGATTSTYSGTSALKATDEWQTVIIDTSKDTNMNTLNKLKGNWSGFRFLFKTPAGIAENTSVSIAWIGVFKSVAEVPRDGDAPLWLDFSDEEVINKTVTTTGGLKTDFGYDSDEQALVMTSTETNLTEATRTPGVLIGNGNRMDVYNSPVDKYPIIAAYIKFGDKSVTFDRFDWTTTVYEASGEVTPWRDIAQYAKTAENGDWKMVYIDTRTLTNGNDIKWLCGNWSGFRLFFKSPVGQEEAASVKVKWIGTFASEAEAKNLAGIEDTPPKEGAMLIEFNSDKVIDKYVRADVGLYTDFGYDETENALAMTSKLTNITEETRTPGVIVGSKGLIMDDYISSVKDYPVIAFYLKHNDVALFDRLDWSTTVYEDSGEVTPWRNILMYAKTEENGDWKLIYVDIRTIANENDTKWLSGNWSGFRALFKTPVGKEEAASVSMKWIGTFASVEGAKKQAGIEATPPQEGPMLIEFNSKKEINNM